MSSNDKKLIEDENDLPFSKIAEKFNMSLKSAAKEFGISKSSLKRRCRKQNIKQWPFRKVKYYFFIWPSSLDGDFTQCPENVNKFTGEMNFIKEL